jgi:hypothetical protein
VREHRWRERKRSDSNALAPDFRYAQNKLSGLSLNPKFVIPANAGIQYFQQLTGFPLAREWRKAKVLALRF